MSKINKTNPKPLYKLYAIDKYANKTKRFIDNEYEEYTLDDLAIELENDHGYHMRICSDKSYIFFGDCDGYNGTFDKFAKLLIDFLLVHYKIKVSMNEISYTENESKNGSFHYSIPKIYGSCKKLKEMHEKFYNKHKDIFCKNVDGKASRVVDTSIYTNKWFRYPNQSKEENDNVKHIIKHGDIRDFIVEYIPIRSVCINNNNYVDVKAKLNSNNGNINNNNEYKISSLFRDNQNAFKNCDNNKNNVNSKSRKTPKDHISDNDDEIDIDDIDIVEKLVSDTDSNDGNEETINNSLFKDTITSSFKKELIRDILSGIDLYDDAYVWTNVGMCLRNESSDNIELFEIWNEWSSKSETNYCGEKKCREKWSSFKKMKMNGFTIHYLLSLLKTSNPVKYEQIQKILTIQKVLKDNKWQFPKNNCTIEEIDSGTCEHKLMLADSHCPMHNDEHSDDGKSRRVFEITDRGTACMKCTNAICTGKICPANGFSVHKNIIKKIFVVNNNNQINIVNNNYGSTNIFDVRVTLNSYPKIYDDVVLNRLIIKSLYEDDSDIADAIVYMYENKICFVDGKWYSFNTICWEECDITNDIIAKFVSVYGLTKEYISKSTNIYGVEKRDHIDQINGIIDKIKNVKKNKTIIALMQRKLSRVNTFDLDTNILAFNNGVYDFEKMVFREANASDMVRTTCGYDYSAEYVDKHGLMEMLSEIFVNDEVMSYFLAYIACSMCGINNFKLLLMLQWSDLLCKEALMKLFASTFGKYYYQIGDLSQNTIVNNIDNFKIVRIVLANSIVNVSESLITYLIKLKCIKHEHKHKINEYNVKFTTLCMCENKPTIDKSIERNTIIMETSDSDYGYDNANINQNDFFLLLVEYLQKFKQGGIVINKKIFDRYKMPYSERICDEFIEDCIEIGSGREKCNDVYDKYIEWANDKELDKQLTRAELNSELKKRFTHKNSIRFHDCPSATGFIGITLKM